MKKLKLTEWAAVAEIAGTVALVISLIFVAYSIKQNTAVMQASNDNFIYEIQFAKARDVVSGPYMASIYAKIENEEELTDEEEVRLYWDRLQDLSTWEISFIRHRDGLFSNQQWVAWDNYFKVAVVTQLPAEKWAEVRRFYSKDFRKHVDRYYSE